MVKKEIGIGFIVGIIATAFGGFAFLEFFVDFNSQNTIPFLLENNLFGKILGLSALPNLFVFFIFLKKKQDYRAKGVVLASFLIAFLVLITQFL
ncbi:MAG: hypothetical protein L3J45_07810 [Flavobacteriaceae bacterium]|nr:hypothetical protein [Flavobacteriaceae bacterium]